MAVSALSDRVDVIRSCDPAVADGRLAGLILGDLQAVGSHDLVRTVWRLPTWV
jgi:hypothetical protein